MTSARGSQKVRNLDDLWHRFQRTTSAADALEEVAAGEWDLEYLLRYHGDEDVDDEDEIWLRDAFDDLLAFYGCVEIAALVGFVPNPLPARFRTSVVSTLGNAYVRRYFRRHYPLILPDALFVRA